MIEDSEKHPLALCAGLLAIAFVLFTWMFTRPLIGFWWQLSLSAAALAVAGTVLVRRDGPDRNAANAHPLKNVLWGIVSAGVLYAVFAVGQIAVEAVMPRGNEMIGSVYTMGEGTPRWLIAILLLVVVGPCEELFWRGYVQRTLEHWFGWKGVALAILAYTGVHIATCNIVLLGAAFVCGSFWGLMYSRFRNLPANMISHGIWAATVFSIAPFVS